MDYALVDEELESRIPKLYTISKQVELLSRNRDPNIIQNCPVCAICCRPEMDCDVISSRNIKTFDGYVAVNIKGASSSSF